MKLNVVALFVFFVAQCSAKNVAKTNNGKKKKEVSVKECQGNNGQGQGRRCKWDDTGLDLDSDEIDLVLEENGRKIKCMRNKNASKRGAFSGRCDGDAHMANFVKRKDKEGNDHIFGTVVYGDKICRFRNNEAACDPASEYAEEEDVVPPLPEDGNNNKGGRKLRREIVKNLRGSGLGLDLGRRRLYDDLGSNLDVMVVWTKDAECQESGLAPGCTLTAQTELTMRGLIDLAVAETNTAFTVSGINTELRLVHAYRDDTYSEPSSNKYNAMLADLQNKNDGKLDSVHIEREKYGADLVSMIAGAGGYCGIAYSGSSIYESKMFSVVRFSCATGNYSFGHEIAHNAGCLHDRGAMNQCSSNGYNYGWRDPNANFRSILAYSCAANECDSNPGGGCTRVQMFSNPVYTYNGQPIGNASNDNRRVFNENKGAIALLLPAMDCQSSADCDDGNSCTIDSCGSNGVCIHDTDYAACAQTCPAGQKNFQLYIDTDNYGGETSWTLVNGCTGATVYSGSGYASNSVYNIDECIDENARYTFTISDSASDGICCGYGYGEYTALYDGSIETRGTSFGSSVVATFGGTCPAPTDSPVVSPTDAPLPSPTDAPIVFPTDAPVPLLTDAPVVSPTDAPVPLPTDAPVVSPTDAPVPLPTDAPVVSPTGAPVPLPTDAPIVSPTGAPVPSPTDAPVVSPTDAPVPSPTDAPVVSPTDAPILSPTDAPVTGSFQDIFINCGGTSYTDTLGRVWQADSWFTGGNVYSKSALEIVDSEDDTLYHSERWGDFTYEIPVPTGDYKVVLHLAEIYFSDTMGARIFDVSVEGTVLSDIDIVQLGGGVASKALTLDVDVSVADGFLSLNFLHNDPVVNNPKISAIEITSADPAGPVPSPTDAPVAAPPPSLESMVVNNVVSDSWTTVSLSSTYIFPIIVCTVQYAEDGTDTPAVTRLNNVESTSFQLKLQNPSNTPIAFPGRPVHCVAVEEGSWTLPSGKKIEAHRFLSTVTDYAWNNWIGQTGQSFVNTYSQANQPSIIGQVMSYNDERWSSFWCRGAQRTYLPIYADEFFPGKMVGEDTDKVRADETVGYIVMDKGHTTNAGFEIETGRGGETIGRYVQGPVYTYNFQSSFSSAPAVAILAQSAMRTSDGSWAVLTQSPTASGMGLATDEDQIGDSERGSAITVVVDYFVMSSAGSVPLSPA